VNFKIDENLPAEIGRDLREAGHEADTVHDEGMTGSADAVNKNARELACHFKIVPRRARVLFLRKG
jgi:hypothetical protein